MATCLNNGEASVAIKDAASKGQQLTSLVGFSLIWDSLDNRRNPTQGAGARRARRPVADVAIRLCGRFGAAWSGFNAGAVLRLRGELQVLSRWLAVQKKSALQRTADEALDAVSRFYLYGQEIDGLRASNRSAETASYYDLASVGVLAVENVLTAGHPSLMRFLMSGLSEGLMFLGSRQYVSGSDAVLLASWRKHSTAVRARSKNIPNSISPS